jgi:ATP-binding cassette, subfamily F, member 3
MPRKTTDSTPHPPSIICTSQQSRFHTETLDATTEVDLYDVSISIGQKDLIESSHLRLKSGVRYALVGRYVCRSCTLDLTI